MILGCLMNVHWFLKKDLYFIMFNAHKKNMHVFSDICIQKTRSVASSLQPVAINFTFIPEISYYHRYCILFFGKKRNMTTENMKI